VESSPIENAIQTIKDKNDQLSELIEKTKQTREWSSQFTMTLNGVIDAAVSGGVSQLSSIFLSNEYLDQNPDHAPKVQKLKRHLRNQVRMNAAVLHGL
jgi:hypothetical protein